MRVEIRRPWKQLSPRPLLNLQRRARCVRCVTRAPAPGKAERFYGNPFAFLAHMAVRHPPERGWISNHNKSEVRTRLGGLEGTQGRPRGFSPPPRPSALTERVCTAAIL